MMHSMPQAAASTAQLVMGSAHFTADPAGALYWRDEHLLIVADLHLEKGSAYAARKVFLPPYDTGVTLATLAALIARYAPRPVLALGNSFHDADAGERLLAKDRASLAALQSRREWIWIAGNHDPALPANLAATAVAILRSAGSGSGMPPIRPAPSLEIAGHCIQWRAWPAMPAQFGAAASSPMNAVASCRRSAPMRAASICMTAPSWRCSPMANALPMFWGAIASIGSRIAAVCRIDAFLFWDCVADFHRGGKRCAMSRKTPVPRGIKQRSAS